MSAQELGVFLKETIHQQGIRITDLSRATALSRETIYKILRGDLKQPKLSSIVKIARALHIHPIMPLRHLFIGWECPGKLTPPEADSLPQKDHDAIGFLGDITYPDNTVVSVNKCFTKTWEIQNIGSVPWIGRRLKCVDKQLVVASASSDFIAPMQGRGLIPEPSEIPINALSPGDTARLSVNFTAPGYPCSAISYWKMINKNGTFCFPKHQGLSCLVQVITF
jgi:transcriptional regulator with XRE-family HTH domain